MNQRLKNFLDAKEYEKRKEYEEEKRKTLLELGLFEKVYAPDNRQSEEFPFYEYDNNTSTSRYYKEVPIEITEDEYVEVKKYSKKEKTSENNSIASALTFIGLGIIICGFIAGCVFGNVVVKEYWSNDTEFSFKVAFTYWIVSFISGMMFFGFAEIIKLLEDIKRK